MKVAVLASPEDGQFLHDILAALADVDVEAYGLKIHDSWETLGRDRIVAHLEKASHFLIVATPTSTHATWFPFAAGYGNGRESGTAFFRTDAMYTLPPYLGRLPIIDTLEELGVYYKTEKATWMAQDGRRIAKATLLEIGISFHADSLAHCVRDGDTKAVKLFLDAGYHPDSRDRHGVPLLCLAARNKHRSVAELLLAAGADLNLQSEDRGYSPLMDASLAGSVDLVELFLSKGADTDIRSKDGQSALVVAVGRNDGEIVRRLLEQGADPDLPDKLGLSARKYAAMFNNPAVAPSCPGEERRCALFNDPLSDPRYTTALRAVSAWCMVSPVEPPSIAAGNAGFGGRRVISIETVQEGFVLNVDGRRILAHSRRAPCVEIGIAENSVRQNRGCFRLRQRRRARSPLRTFKIVENGPEFIAIDFEGRLRMAARLTEGRLRISFSRYDASINLFKLRLCAWPDERIYGCGERYSRVDLKGLRLPLWVEERGMGRDFAKLHGGGGKSWHTTYFPVPVYVSSKNYWCAADTSAYTIFDFRRRNQTVIDSWAVPRELILGSGVDAPAMLGDMTQVLGRQPSPPAWTFDGAWLGVQGGLEEMRHKAEATLAAGAKVAAIWAQDWCGRKVTSLGKQLMWDWSWDRERYPDLPAEIARWRGRGIRFLGYVNPFLAVDGKLYAEASAKGYCLKDAERKDYLITATSFPAAMVDLSNPDAFTWIKDVIKRELLGIGMSGWMADFGEFLPTDAILASGEEAAHAHNRWPVLWAKANREAIEEAGRLGDVIFFMRSGWLGSSRHATAFWAGGQLVNFSPKDGLPSVVPAALSLGLSGAGFWHSDVGGYSGPAWIKRSAECLERWMEMSAFMPLFRSHEGNKPESNAQLWSDPKTLALFARMSEVYASLKPYHLAVASDYVERGLPPIRHPWIHYETDPALRRIAYQYLYGRDLMVAPVLAPGKSLTELYLPEDDWVHLWTSRGFKGGKVSIESPPGCPAVFYRASSPFAQLFDTIRRTVRRTF